MEKIRVNMTPCEEVKTIHASQNDNATRKWAFDLYDENGKIDSSDIKEQMIFDSRVGGTEQILPENTNDPTTSPIIADIQYPDSLRSEQTFLYRESPTSEDGQAKITKIKGNTVVFNQLCRHTQETYTANGVTSTNNNDGSFTLSGTAIALAQFDPMPSADRPSGVVGHRYLFVGCPSGGSSSSYFLRPRINGVDVGLELRDYGNGVVIECTTTDTITAKMGFVSGYSGTVVMKPMIIDITQLNASYITDASSFRSYYNFPYYAYTQGKLLPFKGESLKTTGKNLNDGVNQSYWVNASGTGYGRNNGQSGKIIPTLGASTITVSTTIVQTRYRVCVGDDEIQIGGSATGYNGTNADGTNNSLTINVNNHRFIIVDATDLSKVQVEFGSSASSYEPYISSTINLPTLTYFNTGMKSAGSVYDEITESKATTRIGSVDLGSLSYYKQNTSGLFSTTSISSLIKKVGSWTTDIANIKCALYSARTGQNVYRMIEDKTIGIDATGQIYIYDTAYASNTAIEYATAMSNVYLYYELATPTEESITTASLVTSKGEAPLYYDDELIADCNETISSESGIFDAKIKLMDDETIYSQKIQLHVERKPQ